MHFHQWWSEFFNQQKDLQVKCWNAFKFFLVFFFFKKSQQPSRVFWSQLKETVPAGKPHTRLSLVKGYTKTGLLPGQPWLLPTARPGRSRDSSTAVLVLFCFNRPFVMLVLKEFKPHYRHRAKNSLGFCCFMFFSCVRTQTKQKAPGTSVPPMKFFPSILAPVLP